MKIKKSTKQLMLRKTTISNLHAMELNQVKGMFKLPDLDETNETRCINSVCYPCETLHYACPPAPTRPDFC
ncbi:MAG: hypothetical protein GY765_42130 [bacterium]|nr:hypothetical protein [bacterium]